MKTSSTQIRKTLEAFDERLRLARAAELASCGRLIEAEAILQENKAHRDSAKSWDMLARLSVRLHRFDAAKRRWENALELADNDLKQAIRESLNVLESYQAQWLKRQTIIWWMTLSLLGLSFVIGVSTLVRLMLPA
jgi:tetratricopeptide (TPR) repeat protein